MRQTDSEPVRTPWSVLLDGVWVEPIEISTLTHRYIGMWRPPNNPISGGGICGRCTCTASVQNAFGHDCWLKGHFDSPSYETKGLKP